jgi:hypothetical protein
MIKKIALKVNAILAGQKSLPVCEQCLHGCIRWEIEDPMEMIRHEKHESNEPELALFVSFDRVEDDFRDVGKGQYVFAAVAAADCNEIFSV